MSINPWLLGDDVICTAMRYLEGSQIFSLRLLLSADIKVLKIRIINFLDLIVVDTVQGGVSDL